MSAVSESVLRKIQVCPVCRTSYLPENGEICQCDQELSEAEKQDRWHGKFEEGDCV